MWLIAAILIIAYAVIIVAGRMLLPVVDRYQPQIDAYLSRQLGLELAVEDLRGYWLRLTPVLSAGSVTVREADGRQSAIAIEGLSAELSLSRSLTSLSPAWDRLTAREVRVVARENAEGRWTIGGFTLGGTGGDFLDALIDLMFSSALLRIDNLAFELHYFSGTTATLYGRDLQVENSGDFHRAVAGLALEDKAGDAARLVFEASGDPRETDSFEGSGYLKLERINFSGAISAIATGWFPEQVQKIGDIETDIDAELWFDWVDGGIDNGRGRLRASEIPLNWVADTPALRNIAADITGWYRTGEDWGLQLQGLNLDWGDRTIAPLDLGFRQRVGRDWRQISLAASRLDLGLLHDMLDDMDLADNRLGEVLADLRPRGTLKNLHLDADFSGDSPDIQVRSGLEDIAVDSWSGAPAARGIDGYLDVHHDASASRGLVMLDSRDGLALHYHQAYDDFMEYGHTRGPVRWQWHRDRNRVTVTSGALEISGDQGEGRAFLHLDLPDRKGVGDIPEMYLMVGLRNSAARYRHQYIPRKVLAPELRDWLDSAIGDGLLPQAGFIWRGALQKEMPERRTIQFFGDIRQGRLDFHPDWPALDDFDGHLVLDGSRLDARVRGGDLGGGRVTRAEVALRPGQEGPLLHIDGDLKADIADAFDVLRASPLQDRLRPLAAWHSSGDTRIALDLSVPLSPGAPGARYQVDTRLQGVTLELPAVGFEATDIRGELGFTLDRGLHSDGLEGSLFGSPVQATVATRAGETRVSFDGTIAAAGIARYLGDNGDRLKGEAPVSGLLRLPEGEVPTLTLKSSLEGLAIDLPDFLGKAPEAVRDLTAELVFEDREIRVRGTMGELISSTWLIRDGRFRRGEVRLNAGPSELPAEPGLRVAGELERWDWADWEPLLAGSVDNTGSALVSTLAPRLDVALGSLVFNGIDLGKTAVQGAISEDGSWRLNLDSEPLAGRATLPAGAGEAIVVRLDHLRFSLPDSGGDGDREFLDRLRPGDIPALDFAADAVRIEGEDYGNIAFVSEPMEQGIRFSRIGGNIRGLALGARGAETQDSSPELTWQARNGEHHTAFAGSLSARDLGAVLAAWQQPKLLDSEDAVFHTELAWSDKPWAIAADNVRGYLYLDMEDGRFYRATGNATNAFVKLVGLFNFDTWLRRLRLDFSDFFSEGVSFDRVRGGVAFDAGNLVFDDPIVAEMPSGRMRLLGRADMVAETLDARLVATMPVGTNLPWVVGLLGGLPAAAGVYLAGKLFERQVDQLSSLSYRVTGSWDDPKVEVDRIFSDKTDIKE